MRRDVDQGGAAATLGQSSRRTRVSRMVGVNTTSWSPFWTNWWDEIAGALPLLAHALRSTWQARDGDVLTVEGSVVQRLVDARLLTLDGVTVAMAGPHHRRVGEVLPGPQPAIGLRS